MLPPPAPGPHGLTKRRFLELGSGALVAGAGGLVSLSGCGGRAEGPADWDIPAVPRGEVRIEPVRSERRGRTVDLYTAVPAGFGRGVGLPVCLVLHGASGRPADYPAFGFAEFLTAAARAGHPPFVLAGADGGALSWSPSDGDDPQAMLVEEMPRWLRDRGFDASRLVAWGWSMGGYGALRLAEVAPRWLRAVAAFSPAVDPGDVVHTDATQLAGTPLGVWCGTEDPFYEGVRSLLDRLPEPVAAGSFAPGQDHTRTYWSSITQDAFGFLADHLG